MTSLGLLMMNKGDAMAGNGRFARTGGSLDMKTPEKISVYCARRNASNGVGAETGNGFHPSRAHQGTPLRIAQPEIRAVISVIQTAIPGISRLSSRAKTRDPCPL
jgi:hypothetical protein